MCFGGALGPDLMAAAASAGVSGEQAIADLCHDPLRVLTIGFAPGQPYMGLLPKRWDIARRTELNPRVPKGAIVVAIRQAIVFSQETPTGWWHVGQSGFAPFRPDATVPFAFDAGDQVSFAPVSAAELDRLIKADSAGLGGATCEVLT